MALKILIIQWIIMHCDRRSFKGMQWAGDRNTGIFWLYWKHQSSRSCRERTAESESMYEYYRAWARHKNNTRRRQPRDLKAAFRNALEKKPELERLIHLDTKERIYWRIKDFPNAQSNCSPTQPSTKKPKGGSNTGRKPSNILVQNGDEFPVNFGASTSTASEDDLSLGACSSTTGEDVAVERKKTRKPPLKGGRKVTAKTKKSVSDDDIEPMPYETTMNGIPTGHDETNNRNSLPPFGSLKRSDQDNGYWGDSSDPSFSKTLYDKPKDEDLWTPQLFGSPLDRCTPPQLASDLMDVSSSELMNLLIPNPSINYSFQPSPPQQTSDILFDNFLGADLMSLDKKINVGELKYSFPFQPKVVPPHQYHQTSTYAHQVPVTSSHCSASDFTSQMKTSNFQSNNCVLDSTRITPVNAFLFDQKQCFYDQVVPQCSEAFQTSQQVMDTSEIFVSESALYSPPPMDNHEQIHEELCKVNTGCHSVELFRCNDQTSHDDSGISDMHDFLECANKLLDDIDSKSDRQCHPMF